MNEFGKRIDDFCKEAGITHREFADRAGFTDVSISRLIRSEVPKLEVCEFMSICKELEVTAEELYKTYLFARMRGRVAKYAEKMKEGE